ncbi:hypothetical protein SISSUDRAFT_1128599 [Sistotremastrum suecicum HHB10207 ss-3]|uniref:Uncharacterized protein n=1 Tax=Sistotremastrum suecicum HHB10207 ss-3 TaxID=1314776 RepID=A0A166DNG3_9AGAM|nr:hypothetical protein SISSUDRAFT_1128599 [Sistotremastrum suecicum HHB10207 ss-3]
MHRFCHHEDIEGLFVLAYNVEGAGEKGYLGSTSPVRISPSIFKMGSFIKSIDSSCSWPIPVEQVMGQDFELAAANQMQAHFPPHNIISETDHSGTNGPLQLSPPVRSSRYTTDIASDQWNFFKFSNGLDELPENPVQMVEPLVTNSSSCFEVHPDTQARVGKWHRRDIEKKSQKKLQEAHSMIRELFKSLYPNMGHVGTAESIFTLLDAFRSLQSINNDLSEKLTQESKRTHILMEALVQRRDLA